MDDGTRYSIGELATRTGLPVGTIRFYSDRGIVPPTDRTAAGYRRYDLDAVARLELVRTLRELGLDLPTIRAVVDREASLAEVAATHADAIAVQIRVLRRQRAVLTAVATRGATPEEMDLMHTLARLSEDERRRLIDEFLDAVFGGLDRDLEFAAIIASLTPELPDNPEAEQIEAWIELADLTRDPGFRSRLRSLAEDQAADRDEPGALPRRDPAAALRDHVDAAQLAGVDPVSPGADPIVTAFLAEYACEFGDIDAARKLVTRLETANDPRRDRYLQLLAVINGWPAPESLRPILDWGVPALRARLPG